MNLSTVERWYASKCNSQWEHGYGVRIDTLDNPGWHVRIALHDTKKQDATLERVSVKRGKDNWVSYWANDEEFQIACGPENLSEAIDIFVAWFDAMR